MVPVFEFPSEAERREGPEAGTRFSKDDKKWTAQMDMTHPTLSRTLTCPTVPLHTNVAGMTDNLTLDNFQTYLRDRSVDNIKSDIKTFETEAQALTQATQESFKKDNEWKRTTEMMVSGSSALTGIMLTLGIVPDNMHEGIRGEEPIKSKMFLLLDRDYQLRVDIETKNQIIRKYQLDILKNTIASAAKTATGVPIELSIAKLLSKVASVAVAKGKLQSKLRTIQQRRCLIEADLDAYRQAHQCDESKINDINFSDKIKKRHDDIKAGKPVPMASLEDTMELMKCMMMQTEDERNGKAQWGKNNDGHTVEQIAKEEGETFDEISDKVGQEKADFENGKTEENKGKEKKGKKVKHGSK